MLSKYPILKSLLIGFLIALIPIAIFIIILWNNYPNNKTFDIVNFNENFNYEYNPSDINNFTTNKFLYPAGPISNEDCENRCQKRFKECNSYFPIGTNKWCEYDLTDCQRSCKWNSIFASN